MNIGDRVKTLRKELGLSQKQLAEGVCSQAAISKMENQNFIPSADILYKISQKMGVPISYLLELSVDERVDYVEEVNHQLTKLFEEKDYQAALKTVLAEWKNPTFKNTRFKRTLLWRRGVCTYYIENNAEAAIKYIDEALNLSETTSNHIPVQYWR
ncbi:helix-turn-helix domain-containing protein [Bacillus marinisedimentorum]|uniref:helix-turn-helix domain-containing protein n=1 Tax=Bacillus marinisedimentorum TaxID=1821260 RepID=UPI00087292BF|nr:helix-turn-helix transcriptional regulator [Bacillus marinisedimentorum]